MEDFGSKTTFREDSTQGAKKPRRKGLSDAVSAGQSPEAEGKNAHIRNVRKILESKDENECPICLRQLSLLVRAAAPDIRSEIGPEFF